MKKAIILTLALMLACVFMGCTKSSEGTGSTSNAATKTVDGTSSEAPTKSDNFVIGFSNNYIGNTWRSQFLDDFAVAADIYKEKGIIHSYQVASSNADVTQQLNQLNAMLDSGVDALLIDPVSPSSIKPIIDRAQEMGIVVIIVNDPAAYEDTIAVVGDNASWQRISAIWLVEQLHGKGDIVQITGVAGNSGDTLRQEVCAEILKDYPDINVLGSAPGKWSATEAQSVMTTFLSTYSNIDAVLAQDVMQEGIIKAYENAGQTPAIMTGDSVNSFFKKWSTMPELQSIGVAYAPGIVVTALDVAINMLQGKELKKDVLSPNPLDESLLNTIFLDPIFVVTLEGDQDAKWMNGLVGTQAITLDEAIKMLADKPDTAFLDGWLSAEDIATFFK